MDGNEENNYQDFNDDSNLNTHSQDFSIPDEYKDRGWAKCFEGKSGDELKNDLFKSYDNSQTLIGKKIEDYLNTTDLKGLDNYEEIKENLTKQIAPQFETPENAEGYALNDILKNDKGELEYEYPAETLSYFGDKFKDLGLTKEQGQQILKAYTQFELNEFNKNTDAAELEKSLGQMFHETNGISPQRKNVEGLLKEFLPPEDQQFIQQFAPNNVVEMFYKVAKGLTDKYEFKENNPSASLNNRGVMTKDDINSEYDRIVSAMESLESRPHTDEEKAQYQRQLNALFKI